jgi:hypothetical protein
MLSSTPCYSHHHLYQPLQPSLPTTTAHLYHSHLTRPAEFGWRSVVTMRDADEVVLIYLVSLDHFLRFSAHHLALINPSISSPWSPRSVRSLSHHHWQHFRQCPDLSRTRSVTVLLAQGLNRKPSSRAIYRAYPCIDSSARSRGIRDFLPHLPQDSSHLLHLKYTHKIFCTELQLYGQLHWHIIRWGCHHAHPPQWLQFLFIDLIN